MTLKELDLILTTLKTARGRLNRQYAVIKRLELDLSVITQPSVKARFINRLQREKETYSTECEKYYYERDKIKNIIDTVLDAEERDIIYTVYFLRYSITRTAKIKYYDRTTIYAHLKKIKKKLLNAYNATNTTN